MKFDFRFSNLLGTVYRKGDILFTKDGNTVICPVGNKISLYDLGKNRSFTIPIEARFDYSSIALSPSGNILIAAQEDGELHIINMSFKTIIYRRRMNGFLQNLKFSDDGKHFAFSKERTVFINNTPSCTKRVYDPFSLERTYSSAFDDVLCLDWSHDSRLVCFGSRDMSIHVCGFTKFENLTDVAIGGNTESIVGVFFQNKCYDLCSVTERGFASVWNCSATAGDLIPKQRFEVKKEEAEEIDFEDLPSAATDEDNKDSTAAAKKSKGPKVTYSRKFKIHLIKFLKGKAPRVTAVSYKKESGLLVTGFSSGDFLLVDMSDSGALIHSLNISDKAITSTCINLSGDWIALGVSALGQLVVWEWQSETHVLKQQGHFNSMLVVGYSPDGLNLATGGEDGKLKIWSTQTSFCFVSFSEHTSAVTGVSFLQSGKAVLSSSLDGTVRAFDMIRYRNFKTLTSTKPTQFSCVAVDSSGDLVVAGGQDVQDIFLWSLQTGQLLEILAGHSGPISSVQFSSELGSTRLISTAWDKSVKIWDAIANTTAKETVTLLSEGTCVAFRLDGEQFAVATMNGHITFFNTSTLIQEGCVEGRNDLKAAREDIDLISAKSNLKSKYFTTITYSAEGKYILAAGQSKYVCIYSVEDELLVKKFEITQNRSLDAMDVTISRRKLAENGINLAMVEMREEEKALKVPGTVRGSMSQRTIRPQVRVTSLAFSNTGRNWAACTTEGLLIYSLDDDWLFDPLELEESNTPFAVRRKLRKNNYSTALMMASRLNIKPLIVEVLESIPLNSVEVVVDSLPQMYVESLLKIFPGFLETSRHLGFYSYWVATILTKHGQSLKKRAPDLISQLSDLQKSLTNHYDNLSKVCNHNEYTLSYILSQSCLRRKRTTLEKEGKLEALKDVALEERKLIEEISQEEDLLFESD